MAFINSIISWFNSLSRYFYNLYLEAFNAPYIPNAFAEILYTISDVMAGLAWQFYYFGQWVDQVGSQLSRILTWDTIRSYFLSWIPNIEAVSLWFISWLPTIYTTISNWWSANLVITQDWIQTIVSAAVSGFNDVIVWVSQMRLAWDQFVVKIPTIDQVLAWFGSWPALILAWLDSIGFKPVQFIESLINSIILQFFPFYNDLVSIWSRVLEFFADPLQWVYTRLDEFFERFW